MTEALALSSPHSPAQAGFSTVREGGAVVLRFSGSLTAHTLDAVEQPLAEAVAALPDAPTPLVLDLRSLQGLDTNGALLLNMTTESLRRQGRECTILSPREKFAQLLEKSRLSHEAAPKGKRYPQVLIWCNAVGRWVADQLCTLGQLVGFLGKFLLTLWWLARHPGSMRWTSLVFNMEQVGLRAVPIVGLLTFLIGTVVAYMGAEQLQRFGAQVFAVNLLEVTVLREMAVLITAIVVAGRSSSSFTAQLGAMVANEEVDAMRSMGLDPDVLLVVPRVLALFLCLPMLVFIADIMALLGGACAIWYSMGMSFQSFVTQFQDVSHIQNFWVGIIKTPFFALAIGLVGCFQGFRATGSAESVGLLTTVSVVQSIFVVILLDALFAIFFTTLGI
jgi:phospholipid/cholesterol/gamma-HCH transport system permease protein